MFGLESAPPGWVNPLADEEGGDAEDDDGIPSPTVDEMEQDPSTSKDQEAPKGNEDGAP